MCVSVYYCTLIQYKSGTIIKQIATMNAGSTTLHLVVKIPQILNRTEYSYFGPCNYGVHLQTELAYNGISNWTTIMERFTKLCKMFAKIKRLNLHLRQAYIDKIGNARETIRLLSKDNRRTKRSIFSAIRHVFNIGDYDKQVQLKELVQTLHNEQITTEGELIGLRFVIAHQAEKIKVLQQSAKQVIDVMNSIVIYDNGLSQELNLQHIFQHYSSNMIFDLVTAGIFTNQLLQEYSEIVSEHVHAFSMLDRHYLPPSMISPQDLQIILNNLVTQLTTRYQFLSLQYEDIQTYYTLNNVNVVVQDGNYYIQIPVLFKMIEQVFEIYELRPFYLPLPNQAGKLMKVIHEPFVAINQQAGTFMTLKHNWRKQLKCVGKYTVYCNGIITEQYINMGKNCELAIVSNDTNGIKNDCQFAIVHNRDVSPRVHNIADNRVLLENPHAARIYQKCMDSMKKTFITDEILAEIELPCFCLLVCDSFTTTLVTSDVCITTPEVKLYNPLDNILFLSLLLNNTVRENITINMIPSLILPTLIQDFVINDDEDLLDLKLVLEAYGTSYYHTAKSKIERHENMAKHFSIIKICALLAPIVGIIVILVIIYVSIRTKKLGQLISLLSLSRKSEAASIDFATGKSEYFEFFAGVCTVILLAAWMVYMVLRYYKLCKRIYRTATLPFQECISARNPPSWKLALYISSFNSYCYYI